MPTRTQDHDQPARSAFARRHLHQQILLPLLAASVVVAVSATIIGSRGLSDIIGAWIDTDARQTMQTLASRFEQTRQLQVRHAVRLAQDERLARLLRTDAKHRSVETSAVRAFLESERRDLGDDAIMLVDRNGAVIARVGKQMSPDETVVRSAFDGTSDGSALVTLAGGTGARRVMASVSRSAAASDAAVVVTDELDDELLATSLHGLGGGFACLDADKRVIASYVDPVSLTGPVAAQLRQRLAGDRAVLDAIEGSGKGYGELEIDGEAFRVFAEPLRLASAGGGSTPTGYIVAAVGTNLEYRAGASSGRMLALLSAFGVLALMASGLVVARRVSGPLTELSDGARRVADGDFTHKVAVRGENEIAHLANSFNIMTDSLHQRTESITKKVLELSTLYEMSRSLGLTLDLDVLLGSVLDSALRLFGADSGYVVMRDPETEKLALRAWRGATGDLPDEQALRSSMCEWVTREGRPLIFNPPAEGETGAGRIDNVTGSTAALCVPLVSNEGIIGALTVGSHAPGFRFSSDDVRLLSTIANHATIAVGNIELFSTLQEAYVATVRSLAAAVDAKDPYTRGHSDRVAEFAMAIAEKLDLWGEQRTALEMAAYLHDIGKIGIPEEILLKPGRLDDDEMTQMRHHPLIGANILRPVAFPWAIAPVVRHHHEHWDGGGYPAGLRGEEIPLLARILGVADSFEAMISDRPYRRGRTVEEGLAELERCSGTQFDPRIVTAFVEATEDEIRAGESVAVSRAGDIDRDEARAIFVAVSDGMLGSFRRLGGPRLSANLEAELNHHFLTRETPFSFIAGRLSADWSRIGDDELAEMRSAVGAMAAAMTKTAGTSLVDGFFEDALAGLSARMRALAAVMELYRKA